VELSLETKRQNVEVVASQVVTLPVVWEDQSPWSHRLESKKWWPERRRVLFQWTFVKFIV